MSPHAILAIFALFVLAELAVGLWLDVLNIRHVIRHSKTIPERFRGYIEQPTYEKSAAYALARARFAMTQSVCESLVLLLFVVLGGFPLIDRIALLPGLDPHSKATGLLYFALTGMFFSVVSTPFRLYAQFVLEEKFGFNKMTVRLWLVDQIKALVIAVAIGGPALLGVLWFMEVAGAWWWVWASAFTLAIMLFVQMIFPTLIAPWFNKFTPLADGELKESVTALARKIDFHLAGIYQMDASRRSRHGNAYFTGFGASRRIVLFDTLIQSLSAKELVAVLAHEMGHWKLRHVIKNLALGAVLQFVMFYVLSVLMGYRPFYEAFGFDGAAHYRALAVFMICSDPFTFFLTPLLSLLSRHYEYKADRFAVKATDDPSCLTRALIRLSRDNLSNLTPHPWYSFFHHTHPALAERLEAIENRE